MRPDAAKAEGAFSAPISEFLDTLTQHLKSLSIPHQLSSCNDGNCALETNSLGHQAIIKFAKDSTAIKQAPIIALHKNKDLKLAVLDTNMDNKGRKWALINLDDVWENNVRARVKPKQYKARDTDPAEFSALQRILTIPYNKPAFFTIMGPEGVGKTTTCKFVEDIFSKWPLPLRQFHHTAYWKGDGNAFLKDGSGAVSKNRYSEENSNDVQTLDRKNKASYRAARGLWRWLIPPVLKTQIVSIAGEIQYLNRVSGMLSLAYSKNEIVLSDRYCYDRYVRWLNLGKPMAQRAMARLQCQIMRRPLKAFLLQDTPNKIHARKSVMPLWEIERHQKMLLEVCKHYNLDFDVINIADRMPRVVAADIAARMVMAIEGNLFNLFDVR